MLLMSVTTHSAKSYNLNIARQALDTALQDLAGQTRVQIGRSIDSFGSNAKASVGTPCSTPLFSIGQQI